MKKRIVCFGDSNTWGYNPYTDGRFSEDIRWTCILQKELGHNYTVLEEGLCGRTTVFSDPLNENMSGFEYIYTALMTCNPVDILIVMLGTNDTKQRFNATAKNITDGLIRLINKAKTIPAWTGKPNIIIISPVPIDKDCYTAIFAGEMGSECSEKSYALSKLYKQAAKDLNCGFIDAKDYAKVNTMDYMHIDENGHINLGKAVAKYILDLE